MTDPMLVQCAANSELVEICEGHKPLITVITVPKYQSPPYFVYQSPPWNSDQTSRFQCHLWSSPWLHWADYIEPPSLHWASPYPHKTALLKGSSFWTGISKLIFCLIPVPRRVKARRVDAVSIFYQSTIAQCQEGREHSLSRVPSLSLV